MVDTVRIREVGLREGLQSLKQVFATKDKLELVKLLNQTGVQEIELTALVKTERVPQMADADDFIAAYERKTGVRYTALYLNRIGFERGEQSGRLDNTGWLYLSASKTFFKKNYNRSLSEFVDKLPSWKQSFEQAGKKLHGLMVSCAFGCAYEGMVPESGVLEILRQVQGSLSDLQMLPAEICLADTVGHATPSMVTSLVNACQAAWPEPEISLHLHDTRGLGNANAMAGLDAGVRIFESSLGGVGGCPFAPGASGNVATEELLYLCEKEGYQTGLSLDAYFATVTKLEELIGIDCIPSKLYRALKSGKIFL